MSQYVITDAKVKWWFVYMVSHTTGKCVATAAAPAPSVVKDLAPKKQKTIWGL